MSTIAAANANLPRQWFAVLGAMLAWGADFLLRYAVSWFACAAGWANADVLGIRAVHLLLVLLTLVTGAVAAASGITAWRIRREVEDRYGAEGSGRREAPDPRTRSRFMALLGLFLSALFLFAILLQAVPGLFIPASKC